MSAIGRRLCENSETVPRAPKFRALSPRGTRKIGEILALHGCTESLAEFSHGLGRVRPIDESIATVEDRCLAESPGCATAAASWAKRRTTRCPAPRNVGGSQHYFRRHGPENLAVQRFRDCKRSARSCFELGRAWRTILETLLYRPIKAFLEGLGFVVKGEVGGCDLLALTTTRLSS